MSTVAHPSATTHRWPRLPLWQFSIRNVLCATFFVALGLAMWRLPDELWTARGDAFYFAMLSFRYVPFVAAMGALCGRVAFGLAAGWAFYLVLVSAIVVSLSISGQP
jgi:hypothetical protein